MNNIHGKSISLLSVCVIAAFRIASASPMHLATPASNPVYPVRIGPTGRYLVDSKGRPFLIAGESPQAMMVNISEADAETFFKNRRSHGFNTQWVNLLCNPYTGGRNDLGTIDGLYPFTTPGDLSTPNKAYFAHCDRIVSLAAKYGMLVFLDPAETGGLLPMLVKNGPEKCREFGRYVGKRYAKFDNIVWLHGNDYGSATPENDACVTAVAMGIKDDDQRHLHTLELNPTQNSLDDPRWKPILGLDAGYTYGPTYLPLLKSYNTQHAIPTYLVESGYEFEHLQPADVGTPHQLRIEEYQADLSGSTGQLYGNGYTWPFKPGWKDRLDTPGATEMAYLQAVLEPREWWKLAPDQDHTVVTSGYGTFGQYDYVTAGRTPDGSLIVAYLPESRPIVVDMTKLSRPVVARWYDPASGKYRPIEGSPIRNFGAHTFAPPGDNSDGPGNPDWVLVLETYPPKATVLK